MSIGNKKSKKIITIIFGIILVLLIILLVVLTGHKRSLAKQEAAKKAEAKAEKGLELPYQFDDGKLEMKSIFSYAGPNPDNNAEEGDNIAAIQMTNCSDTYLASASHSRRRNETYLSGRSTPGRQDCYSIRGSEPGTAGQAGRKENRRKDTIFQRCISARRCTDDHRRRYEYWSY